MASLSDEAFKDLFSVEQHPFIPMGVASKKLFPYLLKGSRQGEISLRERALELEEAAILSPSGLCFRNPWRDLKIECFSTEDEEFKFI